MAWLVAVLLALADYLMGSFPTAYLLVRALKGGDIRRQGSGNVGALNAFHQIGLWGAGLVFLVDAGKGAVAVLLPAWADAGDWFIYLSAVSVVIGHNWPVFLRFRGGKGAATILGISLAILPELTLISLGPTLLVILLTRNVVTGVGVGFILLNTLTVITGQDAGQVALCLFLSVLVVSTYGIAIRAQIITAFRTHRVRRLLFGPNWNP